MHHVTAITADVATNLDFYGRLLGLRLVWQGVNADDPQMRHIAYGDERGSPGSLVTFFDMPGVVRGRPGAGMVHRADDQRTLVIDIEKLLPLLRTNVPERVLPARARVTVESALVTSRPSISQT